MAEEVAKLKATVELDLSKSDSEAKKFDSTLNKLEKTIRRLDESVSKSSMSYQKINQVIEKSANVSKKLVTEEDKNQKLIQQARERTALHAEKMYQKQQKDAIKSAKESAKVFQEMAKEEEKSQKAKEKSGNLWESLTSKITIAGLAVNTITGFFNKLTGAMQQSATEALNFQKNMALSNTILDVSKDRLNELSIQVAGMGKELGKAPSEMAMGFYDVASSTDDTADRLGILNIATKASVAGFTDVSTAVDAGIGMMNAFGLKTSDLNKIYDLQFKTVDRGIIKYDELKEALGNMMSSAVNAKVPMEEMLGQLAFLTKAGQNYSKSSIALARAYDSIFEKGDKIKKFLNVDVSGSDGKLRKTTDILADMAKELKKFDEISQINILEEIGFSDRSSRAIIALLGNVEGVRKEIKLISEGTGSMEQAFKKASDNILTEWEKMKAGISSKFSELIAENEEFVKAMISGIGKITNAFIEGVKNWAYLLRGLKDNLKDTFDENVIGAKFVIFSITHKKWLEENKDFVEKSKSLMEEDLTNAEDTSERYRALYENRLRILNEYNKRTLEGVEKTANEKIRLENLAMGNVKATGKTETMMPEKPKQFSMLRKEDYALISESLSIGKLDTSKLKGGLDEIDKVIKAKPTKDQSKKVEIAKRQYEKYVEEVTKAFELTLITGGSLVDNSKKFFTSQLATNELKKINTVKANDTKVEEDLKKYSSKDKDKHYDFIKENNQNLEELKKLHLSDEEYWKERENFLTSSIKNMTEDQQDTKNAEELLIESRNKLKNILNLKDFKKTEEKLKSDAEDMQETFRKIFEEEFIFLDNAKLKNIDINSEEYKNNLFKIYDKQIEELLKISYGTDVYSSQIQEILNKQKNLGIKTTGSYNVQEPVEYSGKGRRKTPEQIEEINRKYKVYNDNLSASSELLSELSSVMGDDFIGALADSINGINSIIGLVGQIGTGAISGLAGGLGIATAVIGIAAPIISSLNDSDIDEKRAEANEKFKNAVEDFKKSVEDMNLSQRVYFANLQKIQFKNQGVLEYKDIMGNKKTVEDWRNLVSYSGGGGGNILGGVNPSNASLNTSELKKQLSLAGYTELSNRVDEIFAGYAKHSEERGAWGKKKSYISGYDTAGAMAEINKLIKEAYDLNLQKFREALNLTADSFVSAIEGAMKEGKTFSITDMVTDSFNKVYADLIGRAGGDILGSKITDIIMQQMATLGISKESFAGMTPQQIIDKINELMKNAPAELQKIFDELGISAEKVNEQFEKIGNRNMPSLLKIGVAEVLASNTYNNSNTVVVQNAYGTVDRSFINLTNKATNSNIYSRTGN